jgi:dienelactone hydrolase
MSVQLTQALQAADTTASITVRDALDEVHRALRVISALAAVAVLASPAASRAQTVSIPVQDAPGSRMPSKPLNAYLTYPGGKGPFPIVILLHGCGGIGQHLTVWARRLAGWGYASLIVDSYAPRGVGRMCAGPAEQRAVTPQDRVGDVVSAALWLRTKPDFDANRIGVVGFSNGGWTAMWATQRRYETQYPNLIKAAISYYGNCSQPEQHGMVPLLALVGEADDWAAPATTCRAFGAQLSPAQNFQMKTYPGAVHDFEDTILPGRWYSEGHPEQYDKAAAEDSFVRARAFLDHYVGHPASETRDVARTRLGSHIPHLPTPPGLP